jgi:SAM-dependent methyltransferase
MSIRRPLSARKTNPVENQSMKCKICGAQALAFFGQKADRAYYRCPICRTVSLFPEPSGEELKTYYNSLPLNYREAMEQSHSNAVKFSYLYKKYLAPYIDGHGPDPTCLLDIGCFSGDFLDICRRQGLSRLCGFEVNETAGNILKKKNIPFIADDFLTSTRFGRSEIDVICMLDVIEHVKEPLAYLVKAYELLKKGGYLIMTSPDGSSIFARTMGRRWPVFDGLEHLQIFTAETMNQTLGRLRFKIVKTSRLLKRTSADYFFKIIAAWSFKKRKNRKRKSESFFPGKLPLTFYAGEFFVIAQK